MQIGINGNESQRASQVGRLKREPETIHRIPALLRELGQIAERVANDPAVSDDERALGRVVIDALAAKQPIRIATAAALLVIDGRRSGEQRTSSHDNGGAGRNGGAP